MLRRSPKYGTFMAFGVGVGVLVAVIASASQSADENYSLAQIIGLMSLIFGAIGLGLGALCAVILDRIFARRARLVAAERTVVTAVPDDGDESSSTDTND